MIKQQLDEVEDRLVYLDAENQQLRAEAKLKSKEAIAAIYNAYAVVDSVRPVLEKALRHPQNWDRVQCQTMHQVLQDYPADPSQPEIAALRLPPQVYHQLVADLREAQDALAALRTVASDQAQLIREQSNSLTRDLSRYEQNVQSLQMRNHEVVLLDGRNKELEDIVQDYEDAIHSAEQDRARVQALQKELIKVTQEYNERLEAKESALLQMRLDFDHVRKELITTQIDLRNARNTRRLGAGGEHQNKPRPSLPSSHSSFALNSQQLSGSARPQQTYRILGPHVTLPEAQQAGVVVRQSPSVARSLVQPVRARRLSDPFQDPPSVARPRGASLDSEKVVFHRPNDGAKPLPCPPAVSPTIPAVAPSAHRSGDSTPLEAIVAQASPQFHMRDPHGLETPTSGKRMLSIIAEASQEGSASHKSVSATSSEKNDYRSSISALDILNSSSSPVDSVVEEPVMHASWAEIRHHHDLRKIASQDLDVSRMYHHNRRHL